MRSALKTALALVLLSAGLVGCGNGNGPVSTVTGAGSSFAYPIFTRWAYHYNEATGVAVNYQSIGSGGGIAAIKAGTVDFGATDAPLPPDELQEADLIQWPMVMGGVVPVIHLQGIKPGQLKLDGRTLAAIYLGQTTHWNDRAIQKLNPTLELPDEPITVVHRSDGSGTTWIFTSYLAKVSKAWAAKVGAQQAVAWPTGLGGPQNAGVASYVERVDGAIGYVEFAYAMQNKMTYALMKNRAGRFVKPAIQTFQSAAAHADWSHAPGFYMVLVDQPGQDSWPITGATFILMHRQAKVLPQARAVLRWCDWSFRHGDKDAIQLTYVPLPDSVVQAIEQQWASEMRGPKGQPLWPFKMQ